MAEALPLVTIVVLNYNGEKMLPRFFPSVLQIRYPNKEFLVLDGGSKDRSLEYLSRFATVRVIDQGTIPGAGHAMNLAIHEAKSNLILFLANDMQPDPDILSFLVPPMVSDKNVAICAPKILSVLSNGGPSDTIDHVGLALDRFGFPKPIGLGEHDCGQYDHLRTTWFVGNEALFQKEAFEKVSGVDETYTVMAEDIDFCWRVKLLGYKILLEPRAIVYHNDPLEHETTTKRFGRRRIRYYAERNVQRMLVKNYSTMTLVRLVPAYAGLFFSQAAFFLAARRLDLFTADFRALVNNIAGFRQIWKQHMQVQQMRTISDDIILSSMNPKSYKFEILRVLMKSVRKR